MAITLGIYSILLIAALALTAITFISRTTYTSILAALAWIVIAMLLITSGFDHVSGKSFTTEQVNATNWGYSNVTAETTTFTTVSNKWVDFMAVIMLAGAALIPFSILKDET